MNAPLHFGKRCWDSNEVKDKEKWFAKWHGTEVRQEWRTFGPFSQFWGFLLPVLDRLSECSIVREEFDLKMTNTGIYKEFLDQLLGKLDF